MGQDRDVELASSRAAHRWKLISFALILCLSVVGSVVGTWYAVEKNREIGTSPLAESIVEKDNEIHELESLIEQLNDELDIVDKRLTLLNDQNSPSSDALGKIDEMKARLRNARQALLDRAPGGIHPPDVDEPAGGAEPAEGIIDTSGAAIDRMALEAVNAHLSFFGSIDNVSTEFEIEASPLYVSWTTKLKLLNKEPDKDPNLARRDQPSAEDRLRWSRENCEYPPYYGGN